MSEHPLGVVILPGRVSSSWDVRKGLLRHDGQSPARVTRWDGDEGLLAAVLRRGRIAIFLMPFICYPCQGTSDHLG